MSSMSVQRNMSFDGDRQKRLNIRNAFMIGGLCSISYLAVYFARNILGAVTPQMLEQGVFTTEFVGTISSVYFVSYAVGQLINGAIGDKVKARYMISFGLILAGISNFAFVRLASYPSAVCIAYGMSGFFLAMIYGPMTKVVAENTEPVYATRCSLGYTFASFLGSPMAGVASAILTWQSVFGISTAVLMAMGAVCFCAFLIMEKKGIVKYNQYKRVKEGGSVKVLIRYGIVRFTFIAIITGVVRTSVVFWLPTYFSQYLGFTTEIAAGIYTGATFIISFSTFIAIFVYECLGRDMYRALRIFFGVSAAAFLCVYFVKIPWMNIVLIILAILASNCSASILWSRYCPSLRDTGMVSSAAGFLDFTSYLSAAAASVLFANAVDVIGWKVLIFVWFALVAAGLIVSLPVETLLKKEK